VSGEGLEELKRRQFLSLGIIRVYTKKPGKTADLRDPVILKAGATVMDVAHHLHKDIAASLNFARLWHQAAGHNPIASAQLGLCPKADREGFEGQRVEHGHVCQDQDILEFHT
jgi:hypothetical protein